MEELLERARRGDPGIEVVDYGGSDPLLVTEIGPDWGMPGHCTSAARTDIAATRVEALPPWCAGLE